MNDDKPSLSEAIRLLAERDRRSLGAHPKIEELAAYHAGELEPQAAARVREHISICRECSDLLLDLINFADLTPPPGEPDLTDDEMEQDWQALRARMGEGKREEPKEPRRPAEVMPIRPAATAPAPSLNRTSLWLPVAASLLAVLGLSFGLYQSAQVAKAREIKVANDIYQGDSTRSEGGPSYSSQEPTALHLEFEGEHPSYEFEIVKGGDVVSKFEVKPKEPAKVDVVIPGGTLDPGQYVAHFYGVGDGERKLLSSLDFVLDDP